MCIHFEIPGIVKWPGCCFLNLSSTDDLLIILQNQVCICNIRKYLSDRTAYNLGISQKSTKSVDFLYDLTFYFAFFVFSRRPP